MSRPRRPVKLTPEQQQLVVQYIPMAKKMAALRSDDDECESAALFALVEAAECYKPDRGVKFGTYAYRHIYGAIINCVNRLHQSFDGEFPDIEEKRKGNNRDFYELIRPLPLNYKIILYHYYINDYNFTQIGKILGQHKRAVHFKHFMALRIVKNRAVMEGLKP
jgi:RNA polymerase sigma factor (sigma-70 family)